MLMLLTLAVALSTSVSAQSAAGFSGRWIAEDTRMNPGGEAVPSAIGAERLPRISRQPRSRELAIEEQTDVVQLETSGATRPSLPLSGLAVTTKDAAGSVITVRALRDGAALVVTREQAVKLPGGTEVLIEIEERHELLPDGTLRVETTSKAGALAETHRAVYRRVVQ